MLSRLIHVVTNGRIPFFLTAEQYSIACTGYIFIHSFIGGHLGCLHSLAIVNNAAMHKKENQISFSLVIYQEVGLLKYMGVLRLIFLEKNFFKFAFPWWLVMLNVFLCTYCLFACLLWKKISIQIPCPFLNLIALSSMSSLCVLGIYPLSDRFSAIFSYSMGCLFILFLFCCAEAF